MSMLYTATVKVLIPQIVRCAHCDESFIYEMTRTGTGQATCGTDKRSQAHAKTVAERVARKNLEAEFERNGPCDPVPCRKCFRHQPYMAAEAAKRHYRHNRVAAWVATGLGVGMVALGAFIYATGRENETSGLFIGGVGAVFALLGIVFAALHKPLVANYDPDKAPLLERKRIARERAMTPSQFRDIQMMRLRDAYDAYQNTFPASRWRAGKEVEITALATTLWVEERSFTYGERVTIKLSAADAVAVVIPEDANPGDECAVEVLSGTPVPFKVRVQPIGIHPDEPRDEE